MIACCGTKTFDPSNLSCCSGEIKSLGHCDNTNAYIMGQYGNYGQNRELALDDVCEGNSCVNGATCEKVLGTDKLRFSLNFNDVIVF